MAKITAQRYSASSELYRVLYGQKDRDGMRRIAYDPKLDIVYIWRLGYPWRRLGDCGGVGWLRLADQNFLPNSNRFADFLRLAVWPL